MTIDGPKRDVVHYVTYTRKDLLLYAVAIGLGADEDSYNYDMRYTYEDHPDFAVVPTFVVIFTFMATQVRSHDDGVASILPAFPPPMMRAMGLIPQKCLKPDTISMEDINNLPVLHTWQSITWQSDIPVPDTAEHMTVQGSFLSVIPKSVGTFVTSETTVTSDMSKSLICRMKSTFLLLGLDKDDVIECGIKSAKSDSLSMARKYTSCHDANYVHAYRIPTNQTLLYRLASFDTNSIHVGHNNDESSVSKSTDNNSSSILARPLLHGLCLLGYVSKYLLRNYKGCTLIHLEAQFTQPLYLGDEIIVKFWNVRGAMLDDTTENDNTLTVFYRVYRRPKDTITLDNGVAILQTRRPQSKL